MHRSADPATSRRRAGTASRHPVVTGLVPVAVAAVLALAAATPLPCGAAGAPDSDDPPPAPAADGVAKDTTPPARIVALPDGRLRLDDITFDQQRREIRFPASVNMTQGLLEYALVHENGKVHESLLVTRTSPFQLNVVLLLLGFRESRPLLNPTLAPELQVSPDQESPDQVIRSRLDIRLEWRDDDQESPRTRSLASWLAKRPYDTDGDGTPDTDTTVPEGPWTYTGSSVHDGRFIAEVDGSIVAVYLDPNAMINNPRKGSDDDDIWIPADGLPEIGTPVTVILSPFPSSPSSPPSPPPPTDDEP